MTLGAKHNQFLQSMLFDGLRDLLLHRTWNGRIRFPIVDYWAGKSRLFLSLSEMATIRQSDEKRVY